MMHQFITIDPFGISVNSSDWCSSSCPNVYKHIRDVNVIPSTLWGEALDFNDHDSTYFFRGFSSLSIQWRTIWLSVSLMDEWCHFEIERLTISPVWQLTVLHTIQPLVGLALSWSLSFKILADKNIIHSFSWILRRLRHKPLIGWNHQNRLYPCPNWRHHQEQWCVWTSVD